MPRIALKEYHFAYLRQLVEGDIVKLESMPLLPEDSSWELAMEVQKLLAYTKHFKNFSITIEASDARDEK